MKLYDPRRCISTHRFFVFNNWIDRRVALDLISEEVPFVRSIFKSAGIHWILLVFIVTSKSANRVCDIKKLVDFITCWLIQFFVLRHLLQVDLFESLVVQRILLNDWTHSIIIVFLIWVGAFALICLNYVLVSYVDFNMLLWLAFDEITLFEIETLELIDLKTRSVYDLSMLLWRSISRIVKSFFIRNEFNVVFWLL